MRETYELLRELLAAQERVALVTLVKTSGSTPRKAGAKMLVLARGETVGTIGGGLVEAKVAQAAQEALATGEARLFTFSLTADPSDPEGMVCGGYMELFIDPMQ